MADDTATLAPTPTPPIQERTDEQIAVDLAPLTNDEQIQAAQLKIAIFEALGDGKVLAPPVDKYDEAAREQVHDTMVLVTQRLEHTENTLRNFTNEIGTGVKLSDDERALLIDVLGATKGETASQLLSRILRTTQAPEPLKEPDPLDPRTAEVVKLIDSGMTFEDAIAQVDKSTATEPAADPAAEPAPVTSEEP